MTPEQQSKSPETDAERLERFRQTGRIDLTVEEYADICERTCTLEQQRDEAREQLKEAQLEADNANEVADALTAYVPDSVRELKLQSEKQLLTAQMAVMVEALNEIKNLVKSDDSIIATKIEVQVLNGLSNEAAAKELLERVKRMADALVKAKQALT